MDRTDRLRHEVFGIAADLADRRIALKHKAVVSGDRHVEIHLADVVERKALIEQTQQRPYRARCIVVLGLREQQRRTAFEVTQVDVVAECRANDLAAT